MSVEVNPVGVHCGRACLYCYELPGRRAIRNARPPAVDHEAVAATLAKEIRKKGDYFSLHGGEPMLASDEDLERLFKLGLERYGRNGVQTDGAVLTDRHFEMFRRYRVHVGFSIDGPGALNGARVAGTKEQTLAASARSEANLRRCLREGVTCGVIVTLHKLNAGPAVLPQLLDWFRDLDAAGLRDGRVHALELDGFARGVALPTDEAAAAFLAVHRLEHELRRRARGWRRLVRRPGSLTFDVFRDLERLLRADDDGVTCIWSGCDPWTTTSVTGVGPSGERTLCQRVVKDGRQPVPVAGGPFVRQLVLAATPREAGGCGGCRFLVACKGQCPGEAEGGDWRRRSANCALWYRLLEHVEGDVERSGVVPVSKRPDLDVLEHRMKAAWARGVRATIRGCVKNRYEPNLGPALSGLAGGERV